MEYQTVLTGTSRQYNEYSWMDELKNRHDNQVKKLISCGWKPLGGVSYSETSGRVVLAQAMVKEG